MSFWLYQGDCRQVLKGFPAESVDAVVTDPPAGIGFMSRDWDKTESREAFRAFIAESMAECFRLMKPGAHGLVWGIPRTSHWTAMGIEDAGFEVRDRLSHFFGTGYPKGLRFGGDFATHLKPAVEDWFLIRKPPIGNIASNLAVHGVGALNVGACRVATDENLNGGAYAQNPTAREAGLGWGADRADPNTSFKRGGAGKFEQPKGRYPAHLILDEESAALLDAQAGPAGAKAPVMGTEPSAANTGLVTNPRARVAGEFHDDFDGEAGPSRFFYVTKTNRAERDFGCEHLPLVKPAETVDRKEGSAGLSNASAGAGRTGEGVRNYHPTIKSVALMRWLVRLVAPPGSLVLDPFTGSGTTGMAARLEGMGFIGVEQDQGYLTIAHARISAVEQGRWRENA